MYSGSVNAALLLSSSLSSENEKITRGIAGSSDFAGELDKLLGTKTSNQSKISTLADNSQSLFKTKTSSSTARKVSTPASGKSNAADSKDTSTSSAGTSKTEAQSAEERLAAAKIKIKAESQTYLTDPVLLESIMSELQVPSETIAACKSLQNSDGWISLKDLNDLISNLSLPAESVGQGATTVSKAGGLISSIVQKLNGSGTTSNVSAGQLGVVQSIDQQKAGYLTLDEFKSMLSQVIQVTNLSQVQDNSKNNAVSAGAAGDTGELAGQTTMLPLSGQSESVVSNIVPSFVSDDSEDSDEEKDGSATTSQTAADSATQAVNVSLDNAVKSQAVQASDARASAAGVDAISALGAVSAVKTVSTVATVSAAPSTAATGNAVQETSSGGGFHDYLPAQSSETGSETAATTDTSSAGAKEQTATTVPLQSLAALAAEYGATVVSSGSNKSAQIVAEAQSQVDAGNASVMSRNTATLAGEAVKDTKSEAAGAQLQQASDLSETTLDTAKIVTRQTESTKDQTLSDRDSGWSSGSDKSSGAGTAGLTQTETVQVTADGPRTFSYYSKAAGTSRQAETADPAQTVSTSASGARATGISSASIVNRLASGDESSQYGSSGGETSSEQGWTESGGVSTVQSNGTEQKSTGGLTEDGTQVQAHESTVVVKEVAKQLKTGNTASDSALLPGAASQNTGDRIQVATAQQSAGGDSNYANPDRMTEIIENIREQYRTSAGRQLVLEMEPEQFGKMSIKVSANKDEVSAVVVTENESARQAMLRNAPELRQSLDDQGLMLGRFQVDVGRDGTGGTNGGRDSGQNFGQGGSKSAVPGVGKSAGSSTVRQKPAYLKRSTVSQVSIMA